MELKRGYSTLIVVLELEKSLWLANENWTEPGPVVLLVVEDEFGGNYMALRNPHIFDKLVFSHRTGLLSASIFHV